jgi:hypothetical protein
MRRGYSRQSDECEVRCVECGVFFIATSRRQYCTVTCRSAAWRRDHPIVKHIAPEYAS